MSPTQLHWPVLCISDSPKRGPSYSALWLLRAHVHEVHNRGQNNDARPSEIILLPRCGALRPRHQPSRSGTLQALPGRPAPPAPTSRDPAPLSLLPYRWAVACSCAWSLARSIPSLASYRVSLKQWICSSRIHCDASCRGCVASPAGWRPEGRRRWPSVTALAQELGVAVSTTTVRLPTPSRLGRWTSAR